MALLNIFKKKGKVEKKKEVRKEVKEAQIKTEKEPVKRIKAVKTEKPARPKKVSEIAYRVLKGPHVTEKATYLLQKNQYVFKTLPRANKTEIKKAIEDLYGVNVTSVNIVKIPSKKRRLGKIEGYRSGYKKAIVKIKKGQKIEVLPR